MKTKTLFILYLLLLLWLILFKLTYDFSSVLAIHVQNIHLIPFFDENGSIHPWEIVSNVLVFLPMGILLHAVWKQGSFESKLLLILLTSLTLETMQFALAIGVSDITDIITNTLGGFIGLKLYELTTKYLDTKKADMLIQTAGVLLITLLVLLRILVFKVRY